MRIQWAETVWYYINFIIKVNVFTKKFVYVFFFLEK